MFSKDPKVFREELMNIARTSIGSKILNQQQDKFANLAVDAVMRLKVRYDCFFPLALMQQIAWSFKGCYTFCLSVGESC